MVSGSKFRLILWIPLFVAVGAGLGLCLWGALPGMAEKRLYAYAREAGLDNLSFEVRKVGLFQADLGSVVLGDPSSPALTVAAAQADYAPWDLMRKRVRSVKIAGVQVFAKADDRGFSLRGMKIPFRKTKKEDASPSPALPWKLPVDIAVLDLDSASFNLDWNGAAYRLPLEARAARRKDGAIDCALTVHPRGQALQCHVVADLNARSMAITLDSDGLEAGRFGDLTSRLSGLLAKGGVSVHGKGGWKGQGLESLLATLSLAGGEIHSGPVRILSPPGRPLTAHASFGGNQAEISIENIRMAEPVDLEIPAMEARIGITDAGLTAEGHFSYSVRSLPGGFPFVLEYPVQAKAKFSAARAVDGAMIFSIENDAQGKDIVLIHNAALAYIAQPVWKVSGGRGTQGDLDVDFSLAFPDINMETGSAKARVPALGVMGKLVMQEGQEPVVKAMAEFRDGQFLGASPDFRISGIRGKMPFTYPSQKDKGKISIGSVRIGTKEAGGASLDLERQGLNVVLKGRHQSALIPGLTLDLTGNAGLDDRGDFQLHSRFGVSKQKIAALDLGKFGAAMKGTSFDGVVTVEGFASLEKGKLDTGMDIAIAQGKVQAPGRKMEMSGMGLSLVMEDLATARSAPRQVFSFDSARMGSIKLDKGKVEFIVESAQSLFVEKSSFGWCNGRVYSPAAHFKAGASSSEFLLFCDRLDFVELLKQLGAPSAKGSGSLNGIIPVSIVNGQFRFNQGHLYSTPGAGGAIRLKGDGEFMKGMAAGTPQEGQLTLAKLALEDYQYEWAKLEINSEGENLLLKLQLDGKPSGPLPLVPDPKTGKFQRVDSPEKGAIFQGIKLNLNVKLPLDQLLKYGIKLKDYL